MKRVLLVVFLISGLIPAIAFAMTSTNYGIGWDSVNSGGEDTSTSTNFLLRDTIGEQATGIGSSQNYQLSAGYRVGDTQDPFLALVLGTQENFTQVSWNAFSNLVKTVTLSATSSFAVGNYIGVVENVGPSQLIAVGKITDITGLVATVDSWSGVPGSLSASPSGNDDFAYRLDGGTADLGTRIPGFVGTSLTMIDALSNAQNGYSVTVQADGGLRNAANQSITDVSDGAVSAGSEEYGGQAVGTTAVVAADFAFPSTSTRNVQTSATFGDHDRVGIIYKMSVTNGTPTGNYNQMLYYRLTSNF